MVKIYTLPNCPRCTILKRILVRENVGFEEIRLDQEPKTREWLVKQHGVQQAPVLQIGGEIHGFKTPEQIRNLLTAGE